MKQNLVVVRCCGGFAPKDTSRIIDLPPQDIPWSSDLLIRICSVIHSHTQVGEVQYYSDIQMCSFVVAETEATSRGVKLMLIHPVDSWPSEDFHAEQAIIHLPARKDNILACRIQLQIRMWTTAHIMEKELQMTENYSGTNVSSTAMTKKNNMLFIHLPIQEKGRIVVVSLPQLLRCAPPCVLVRHLGESLE